MTLQDSEHLIDRERDAFEWDSTIPGWRKRTTADVTGEIRLTGLNIAGKITEVTINNTGWTALPATALTDRNALAIQNWSDTEVKINYDNTVGYVGMIISANGGERQYDITDNIVMYGRSSSGTKTLYIEEIS